MRNGKLVCWCVGWGLACLPTALPCLSAEPSGYAIAIHGGAMDRLEEVSAEERAACEASLRRALAVGRDVLAEGGSGLDAVERVIRLLEDDPLFNAGRGAVLNEQGQHELDASIMDGHTLQCGAVAGVRAAKNPISLARLVMTKTRHVLLAGAGAEAFAVEVGAERAEEAYFRTPKQVEQWERRRQEAAARQQQEQQRPEPPRGREAADAAPRGHMGTVGCAALDTHGHLAAGTSTGGRLFKMPGRVGDSPIIGAGTYANDASCAVSCTGVGEEFIRRAVAYDISAQVLYRRVSLDEAVQSVLSEKLPPASGGIIAVDAHGEISLRFSTAGMMRAAADSKGRFEVAVGP